MKENKVTELLPEYYRNLEFKLKDGTRIKGYYQPEFDLGDGGPWFSEDPNEFVCRLFSLDEVVSWHYI